ncbi:MAG TPA: helix-turn-helix domain-containing protein [Pyrinomonadaceae bacterium]|nr:helix-turn-helix domain-containing protein [Pyrinomonadaceae bacterium]
MREENVYDDGYLRVEHDNYYVECKGQLIALPRAEFLFFSRLTQNADRFIESRELWRYVWGDQKPLNLDSLHVFIYRLRKKFEPFGIGIETLVGVGYRLSLRECCPQMSGKK